jgi:two-component system, cell cycle response regulator CpdR
VDHPENPLNASGPKPSTFRILYVEDNDIVREITTELLMQNHAHVVASRTAEEALQEFKEAAFDIVITDISLPAMSGLDLSRTILDLKPNMPIIVASGYFMDMSLQTFGPSVRAIIKPFEVEEIDVLITELCAGAEPEKTSHPPPPF